MAEESRGQDRDFTIDQLLTWRNTDIKLCRSGDSPLESCSYLLRLYARKDVPFRAFKVNIYGLSWEAVRP
ncbi:hypothetical protein KY366_03435 [Candidatus Woesearchaeota archaeon]|nr:hypothetical protein [Candidatus Woesearchaeota archaeon]